MKAFKVLFGSFFFLVIFLCLPNMTDLIALVLLGSFQFFLVLLLVLINGNSARANHCGEAISLFVFHPVFSCSLISPGSEEEQ